MDLSLCITIVNALDFICIFLPFSMHDHRRNVRFTLERARIRHVLLRAMFFNVQKGKVFLCIYVSWELDSPEKIIELLLS